MKYLTIIEAAINFMENHIDSDITVFDIARAVGYSYYHLSHIFPLYVHETIGSYLKNRKLSYATKLLLNTDKRLLDISLELGFTSNEAFTRAFKKRYHINPFHYRKRGQDNFNQ